MDRAVGPLVPARRRCRRRGGRCREAPPCSRSGSRAGDHGGRPRRPGPSTSWCRPSIAVDSVEVARRASAWRMAVDDTAVAVASLVATRPSGSTSKPWPAPIVLQQRDVAATAVAEVEVLADDDSPCVEAVDEHLLDEVLRRLRGTPFVEGEHDRVVDAGCLDALESLLEVGEQRRRRLRPHDRGGVTVERDDCGARTELRSPELHLCDHRAVTEVHSVVRADRDHAALGGRGHGSPSRITSTARTLTSRRRCEHDTRASRPSVTVGRRLVDREQLARLVDHGPRAVTLDCRARHARAPCRDRSRRRWRRRRPRREVAQRHRGRLQQQSVHRPRLVLPERSDSGATERLEVRATAERVPEVGGERSARRCPRSTRPRRGTRADPASNRHRIGARSPAAARARPRCPPGPARAGGGRPTFSADTIGGTCMIGPVRVAAAASDLGWLDLHVVRGRHLARRVERRRLTPNTTSPV